MLLGLFPISTHKLRPMASQAQAELYGKIHTGCKVTHRGKLAVYHTGAPLEARRWRYKLAFQPETTVTASEATNLVNTHTGMAQFHRDARPKALHRVG